MSDVTVINIDDFIRQEREKGAKEILWDHVGWAVLSVFAKGDFSSPKVYMGMKHIPPTPSTNITEVRHSTHGSFEQNALISQGLKSVFASSPHYDALDADMKESLDMIALKLSRILSGNPHVKDHWTDISGYAQLIEKRIK